jgi:hypothetical protein
MSRKSKKNLIKKNYIIQYVIFSLKRLIYRCINKQSQRRTSSASVGRQQGKEKPGGVHWKTPRDVVAMRDQIGSVMGSFSEVPEKSVSVVKPVEARAMAMRGDEEGTGL